MKVEKCVRKSRVLFIFKKNLTGKNILPPLGVFCIHSPEVVAWKYWKLDPVFLHATCIWKKTHKNFTHSGWSIARQDPVKVRDGLYQLRKNVPNNCASLRCR